MCVCGLEWICQIQEDVLGGEMMFCAFFVFYKTKTKVDFREGEMGHVSRPYSTIRLDLLAFVFVLRLNTGLSEFSLNLRATLGFVA